MTNGSLLVSFAVCAIWFLVLGYIQIATVCPTHKTTHTTTYHPAIGQTDPATLRKTLFSTFSAAGIAPIYTTVPPAYLTAFKATVVATLRLSDEATFITGEFPRLVSNALKT